MVIDYCFRHGLLAITAGRNTIRVVPPLNIIEEEMDEGMDILEEAIASVNAATAKT